MKLYYLPGACSLAPHIALNVTNTAYELVKVDTKKGLTEHDQNYAEINPKGSVPAVKLENGEVLTEGVAILQYIADQNPESQLAPTCGSMARIRLYEQLNYITSEVHKSFSPLFNPNSSDQQKADARAYVEVKLSFVNDVMLGNKSYVVNDQFSVADIYLFVVCNWTKFVDIDISKWSNLSAFMQRMQDLQAVKTAMKKEGLIG